mmetsp:Transcript_43420/g.102944  ORF Transcript_43420/g.102944 Transcript_43420/m.102944 type:complete len:137 (-) Transcript_43420:61-471(-)
MDSHFQILSELEAELANGKKAADHNPVESFVSAGPPPRMDILKLLLKCADIGHCASPFPRHREWCARLETELFSQGDVERRLGLPISSLADRCHPGAASAEVQVVFFNKIVLPMFRLLTKVCPAADTLLKQAELNW